MDLTTFVAGVRVEYAIVHQQQHFFLVDGFIIFVYRFIFLTAKRKHYWPAERVKSFGQYWHWVYQVKVFLSLVACHTCYLLYSLYLFDIH